jgi:cyanophycinase
MSSEEPDSAYIYFKKQVEKLTPNPIVMLNFNKQTATNQILVDSLQKQNLFFISGETKVGLWKCLILNFEAIHRAYIVTEYNFWNKRWSCSNVRTYDHRKSKT